jgi:hypothetical protein
MKSADKHTGANAILYGMVRDNLLAIGFAEAVFPGSHILLEEKKTETKILLPFMKPTDAMQPVHLAALQTRLAAKGLIQKDQFETLITGSASRITGERGKVLVKVKRPTETSNTSLMNYMPENKPGVFKIIASPVATPGRAKIKIPSSEKPAKTK